MDLLWAWQWETFSSTYIVAASQYFKALMERAGATVKVVNCDGDGSLQADQIADFSQYGRRYYLCSCK